MALSSPPRIEEHPAQHNERAFDPTVALVVDGEEGFVGRVRRVSWREWRSSWADSFVRKSPGGNTEERE
jgi:hypothetical protein